jgi:aspartyl protease family protein
VRNVQAAVAEEGALDVNLLGMSFLGRLKSFNMRGNELILIQ